jgi:biopolymer transport protein ExbB
MMPEDFTHHIRQQISEKHFEEALEFCERENNFASNIIASGLSARNHGSQVVMDTIQAEGQRAGSKLWQRIGLLNDIVVIAPMFGLLGTVLGLFFAFYDTSNTTDNLASIFDGLGIAVGTTVLGLIVAIMAMVFYTTLKYRVVNLLNTIENESFSIVNMIQVENKK